VDRAARPPRAVALAFYPRALSNDPLELEHLSGVMERLVQLHHPNVVAPTGIEAVGDDLAAVTVWRDAVTLREILDAGGPLPSDLAARIAADVCAGLGHAHGRAEPVAHGLIGPEAVLVDESGSAALSGFGMSGVSSVSDDLVGVGKLLHECLVGKPLEQPAAALEAPGVPASLAAVVNAACAADGEGAFPTAEALGEAIALAAPLAPREEVAAHLEAIVPAGTGLRAQRRRRIDAALGVAPSAEAEEITDEDIVCAPTPAPAEAPAPGDVAAPPANPAAPVRLGPRVPVWAALAMSIASAAIGFGLAWFAPWNAQARERLAAEARAPADAPPPAPVPSASAVPTASAVPSSYEPPPPKRSSVRQPAAPRRDSRAGLLEVTAPDGAEIWLDGRRIGTGNTRRSIPAGDHRVEVRHAGAKVGERFHVASGETWTYAVTPR
jgi:hypothetical protein